MPAKLYHVDLTPEEQDHLAEVIASRSQKSGDLVKHFDTTQLSGFWSIQELLFKRIWTDVIQR